MTPDESARRRWMMLAAAMAAAPDALLAQDAQKVQPDSFRVALDNAYVRVLDYRARPGMGVCGSGLHSHPAHLTVILTPQRVRETVNGKSDIVEVKPGDVFWSEAVTHETENLLGIDARSLIVELKRCPT